MLDLLVADRLLVPAERRYTQAEVAEMTGMDLELARRFWRALGLPRRRRSTSACSPTSTSRRS